MSYAFIKDFAKFLGRLTKVVTKPVVGKLKDVFRKQTVILGPSKSGKTTLGKILRGEGYFIGEYNHTSELILIKKDRVATYESTDSEEQDIKLKVKHDVPGESLDLWGDVIRKNKPKGVILIFDLYGIVKNGSIDVESDKEFIDFDAIDKSGQEVRVKTTAKKKFHLQVGSFRVIQKACIDNGIELKAMMVFLNKFEKWQKDADLTDVVQKYQALINKKVNLTVFAKDVGLTRDVQWEVTSLNQDYHSDKLEPALHRFSKLFS